jgi:pimeloyl-ACP methyl ester carboxylesterase
VPELSKRFTVYALDYPGHGYSDIPQARYDAAFFTKAVEGFLDKLDLRDVTLAGVSIGERSPSSSPRVATLEWRALSPSTPTTTPRPRHGRAGLFGAFVTYASLVPWSARR